VTVERGPRRRASDSSLWRQGHGLAPRDGRHPDDIGGGRGAITGTLRPDVVIAPLPRDGAVPGRVTALDRQGLRYSTVVLRSGRFTLRLPPGRYG
jgi:hypothetical protein